jgi:hypothetical protein
MTAVPSAGVVAEAGRLVAALGTAGIRARLIGGLGVAAHDHIELPTQLQRTFADIDIVIPERSNRKAALELVGLGYTPNDRFNALHGARRLLFYDDTNSRQLDVFVGQFAMCHRLDLNSRLNLHPTALTASDLLLTKLQIVQLNQKDILDALRLLLNHPLADVDDPPTDTATLGANSVSDALSVTRIVSITSADWGWHTTLGDNLHKVAAASPQLLATEHSHTITARIDALLHAMQATRKGMRWKARSTLGRRAPWYELPEEITPAGGRPRG